MGLEKNDDDRVAQKEEMEILMEILDPGTCFSKTEGTKISEHLDTKVRIPGKCFRCKCQYAEDGDNDDGDTIWTLEHLPPLTLHFTLPSDYPSNSKPDFTLSSKWLSSDALSVLCKKLDDLWEENKGTPILFKWHSYLKEETLNAIGFDPETVYDLKQLTQSSVQTTENPTQSDPRAIVETWPEMLLLEYFVGYDQYQRKKEFLQSVHSCSICLYEKRGSDCILLSQCKHVFCVECLKDYFSLHITEGSLDSVKCPDLKCQTVPTQKEVKTLVGPQLFERYDTILLNRGLDSMQDVTPCPRISCGQPVLLSDPKEKLGECSSCRYAFCTFCKLLYHGVEPCVVRGFEAEFLYEQYINGTKKEKEYLEKKYGKKQIKQLEQAFSDNWVSAYTKPCPSCKVPIEKNGGCNHMICFKCNINFNWIDETVMD